jgi:hypothetical protein
MTRAEMDRTSSLDDDPGGYRHRAYGSKMASTPEPSGESPGATPVRTIKLCPTTTTRPTTLRIAIDRSIVELARTGRIPRPISLTTATTASA